MSNEEFVRCFALSDEKVKRESFLKPEMTMLNVFIIPLFTEEDAAAALDSWVFSSF